LIASVPAVIYLSIPVSVPIVVTGYSVDVNITGDANQLPVLLSDNIESPGLMAYAVPLVRITVQNGLYVVPLSSRHYSLNSSDFFVTKTGEYMLVRLDEIPVEYVVGESRILPHVYDQRDNSQFDYFPIYRDAEIYYTLRVRGYYNITTVSMASMKGMITSNLKLIYAVKNGNRVLVQILIEGESVKLDETAIISTDKEFMNLLILNMKIAEVSTSINSRTEEPTAPFVFVQSSSFRE